MLFRSELEEELGIEIFARHGKRLKRITEPGQHVLKSIELILREVGNLRKIGEQFSAQDSGTLSIATTHTQARYVLPVPVAKLRERYPKVNISLHQGAPDQVALDSYLDSVREIERRIQKLAANKSQALDLPATPAGIPDRFDEHIRLMFDIRSEEHTSELQSH